MGTGRPHRWPGDLLEQKKKKWKASCDVTLCENGPQEKTTKPTLTFLYLSEGNVTKENVGRECLHFKGSSAHAYGSFRHSHTMQRYSKGIEYVAMLCKHVDHVGHVGSKALG